MKKEGPSGRNPDGPSLEKSVNFGWMSVNFREVGVNFRRASVNFSGASVNFVGKGCEDRCLLNPIAAHSPGADNTRPSSDYTQPLSANTRPRSDNTHLIFL